MSDSNRASKKTCPNQVAEDIQQLYRALKGFSKHDRGRRNAYSLGEIRFAGNEKLNLLAFCPFFFVVILRGGYRLASTILNLLEKRRTFCGFYKSCGRSCETDGPAVLEGRDWWRGHFVVNGTS